MTEWYAKITFGSLTDTMAERFGQREALVYKDERFTFQEVHERTDELACGLIQLGIKPGDHVALWLMNRPEWIFTMFALARIGAVQVPVNTRFRTHDLAYLLKQSDASYLITHDISGPVDFLAMVRDVVNLPEHGVDIDDPEFPVMTKVIILSENEHRGCVHWNTMLDAGCEIDSAQLRARVDACDPDLPVFIMYTSGTTGFPKGAMHSHIMLRLIGDRAFRCAITENDTILNYLPLYWILMPLVLCSSIPWSRLW